MRNKLTTLFLSIVVLCATVLTAAQTGSTRKDMSPRPVAISEAQAGKLPAPQEFSSFGVHFYDFRVEIPNRVIINLYDQSKSYLAGIELNESVLGKDSFYRIRVDGVEEWVNIEVQTLEAEVLYTATSSAGTNLKIKLGRPTDESSKAALPVKDFGLYRGDQWVNVTLTPSVTTQGSRRFESTLVTEEQKFFTTPQLKILQQVLLDLKQLQTRAFGNAGTCLPNSAAASSPDHSSSSDEEGLRGCIVWCYRLASLVPMFWCDGGLWNNCTCRAGSGVFLMPGCGIRIQCDAGCGEFPQYETRDTK